MNGDQFYITHTKDLKRNQRVSRNGYVFVEWASSRCKYVGGLMYLITGSKGQYKKNIQKEMIINAYNQFKGRPDVDKEWVYRNGQSHWCHEKVLNFLFEKYLQRGNRI